MDNRPTLAAMRKKFGSLYHIAKTLNLCESTVSRWGKYVPEHHVDVLLTHPGGKLKRGGKR